MARFLASILQTESWEILFKCVSKNFKILIFSDVVSDLIRFETISCLSSASPFMTEAIFDFSEITVTGDILSTNSGISTL